MTEKLLYKELSYKLQGLFFDIRNDLGSGHKESIYQKALEKEFKKAGLEFIREPAIKIYARDGEFLGLYRPDFLVEDKIIIEVRATQYVTRQESARVYDYLRNSQYELAYLVNFASQHLYIKRLLFTNDRKRNLKIRRHSFPVRDHSWIILFVAISVTFVAIRGTQAQAARFFLESAGGDVRTNEPFAVQLFLDTEGESVNALEGAVHFPSLVDLETIQDGGSIVTFWLDTPARAGGGRMYFSGITPGGYAGNRGYILTAVFHPRSEGNGEIRVSEARAFRNDGFGTPLAVRSSGLAFTASRGVQLFELPLFTEGDILPPEPFTPLLAREEGIFKGRYFLVFATQDKGSGISHYEILELPQGFTFSPRQWGVVESPYIVEDQSLRSILKVKAVDRRGNERIATFEPPPAPPGAAVYAAVAIMFFLSLCVHLFLRKRSV